MAFAEMVCDDCGKRFWSDLQHPVGLCPFCRGDKVQVVTLGGFSPERETNEDEGAERETNEKRPDEERAPLFRDPMAEALYLGLDIDTQVAVSLLVAAMQENLFPIFKIIERRLIEIEQTLREKEDNNG